MQVGFTDVTAIGGLAEPVSVAFAGDGTAFIALKTGVIKSFDYDDKLDAFEPAATSTDFADLSVAVNNYGDRGMTGITVDPQFPARPRRLRQLHLQPRPAGQPTRGAQVGRAGPAVRRLSAGGRSPAAGEDGLPGDGPGLQAHRHQDDARLDDGAEQRAPAGGPTAVASSSSHASGDVVFGPDGLLYASAGDGASFGGKDFGQANNPCGDPQRGWRLARPGLADEAGATRSGSAARSSG